MRISSGIKPSACSIAATFRFDLIKYMGTESSLLEDVGAASTHAEQPMVPNTVQ
jgi:hypothetical protein